MRPSPVEALLYYTTYAYSFDSFNVAMDVSADLTELGRTNVAVVTSGVKSILDIERTLEFLVRLSPYHCLRK